MQHNESWFEGHHGLKLYCQSWTPDTPPKAILAIVHGFGEHSGRYMNLVNCFVLRGYAVHSFDLRGHGRSPGRRGHVLNWSEYRLDVDAFLRMIARSDPHTPMFLYGHSLGGLIVLDYALHDPVALRGVISSAPALGQVAISPVLLALSRIMSRVSPTFSIRTQLDATMISRDPAVVSAYTADPTVHDTASARLGTEMAAAQEWVQAHAGGLHLPLLLFQGSMDRLVNPAGGQQFFRNVPDGDKQYIAYDGSFHEVHNDLDQQKAFDDIAGWLELH